MQTKKRKVGTDAVYRGKVLPFRCSCQSQYDQHESQSCKKQMIFLSCAGCSKSHNGLQGFGILTLKMIVSCCFIYCPRQTAGAESLLIISFLPFLTPSSLNSCYFTKLINQSFKYCATEISIK